MLHQLPIPLHSLIVKKYPSIPPLVIVSVGFLDTFPPATPPATANTAVKIRQNPPIVLYRSYFNFISPVRLEINENILKMQIRSHKRVVGATLRAKEGKTPWASEEVSVEEGN